MLDIKLARKRIPVESACGLVEMFERHSILWLIESGRVARIVQRKSDSKVIRLFLLALPNEIAHRSPQSTVQEIAPTLWCERVNLYLFQEYAA